MCRCGGTPAPKYKSYAWTTNGLEGPSPTVFHQATTACRSASGGTDTPHVVSSFFSTKKDKSLKGIEDTEKQELDQYGYDSPGSTMVLVKSLIRKWGKHGVKGCDHLGWRSSMYMYFNDVSKRFMKQKGTLTSDTLYFTS